MIVETVGVGQMEVDVASATDTTVVVVTPGWGDSMQANKAGLLEVADLFVINKADRPGAREARRDLDQMLDLSAPADWRPPMLETSAADGRGVEELWGAVADHRAHLLDAGRLSRPPGRAGSSELAPGAGRPAGPRRSSGPVRARGSPRRCGPSSRAASTPTTRPTGSSGQMRAPGRQVG